MPYGFLNIRIGNITPPQLSVAINDVVVGVAVDGIGTNHFAVCVERNRLLNAMLLGGLLHFLAAARSADANDDHALGSILFPELDGLGNGGNARTAPRRPKVEHDDFTLGVRGLATLGIQPLTECQLGSGLAVQPGDSGSLFASFEPGFLCRQAKCSADEQQ